MDVITVVVWGGFWVLDGFGLWFGLWFNLWVLGFYFDFVSLVVV